jgi:hypothetical protein
VAQGASVQLSGGGSSDADGDPLTYEWTMVERPSGSAASLNGATGVSPTFTADLVGTYRIRLVANDGSASSAPDTVRVTAQVGTPTNQAPAANAGADQTVDVGALVQLSGKASSDPDGDPITHAWTWVSQPAGSKATLSSATAVDPSFTADVAGTYRLRLIVRDGSLNSPPDEVIVTARVPVNQPPVADAGPDQGVIRGASVQLDGGGSRDPDGDPITHQWTLDKRPTGSTAALSDPKAVRPTFRADVAGTYEVTLVVSDGSANSAPDLVRIVATPPDVTPPRATTMTITPNSIDGTKGGSVAVRVLAIDDLSGVKKIHVEFTSPAGRAAPQKTACDLTLDPKTTPQNGTWNGSCVVPSTPPPIPGTWNLTTLYLEDVAGNSADGIKDLDAKSEKSFVVSVP